MSTTLLAVAGLGLLGTVLGAASCSSTAGGVVDGRLADCPPSPNCVCSEDEREGASILPLAFEGDPQSAFRSLLAFLADEPRTSAIRSDETYAHVVFTTRFLRFRDDLELRLDAPAGVIHVRSASRAGYSDLGVNRRRVESIRSRWDASDR